MKTPLLFLCHRIPYPPNKGDKIRSFHLLHHLAQHFTIYLATFVDDPDDWPWVPEVEKFCADSLFLELKPWQATLRGLTGLLRGQALSVPYYASDAMQAWVSDRVREHHIEHALVFSSAMGQFATHSTVDFKRKVIDFVDIDSDKWEQYALQKPFPLSMVYRREARRLFEFEQRLARDFDAGLFVSSTEAELFRKLSPDTADKIGFYNNGVNADYFVPDSAYQNPYPDAIKPLVFTGAMDYWPNIDAVTWFASEVLPGLLQRDASIRFYIVGSNPSRAVQQLADYPGVEVTGRVEDVRPYLAYARLAVAPMRIARGVQNKVLEAMAMEKPVIVSNKGLEGIDARHADQVLVAEQPAEYQEQVAQVLAGDWKDIGCRAREFVTRHFAWESNLPEVVLLLDGANESAEASLSHG